jgi:hypothetical protein
MTYLRRLEGYTPPERVSVHWTSARIEEAASPVDTPIPLATITLSPAITNPADPPSYDFETTLATLLVGWYRVVWIDSNGDRGYRRSAASSDRRDGRFPGRHVHGQDDADSAAGAAVDHVVHADDARAAWPAG